MKKIIKVKGNSMNQETKAMNTINKQLSKGKTFEDISEKTGYRKEKLFRWHKLNRFPAMKIAKRITRAYDNNNETNAA